MTAYAQAFVKDIVQAGGIITEQDLHDAQPTIKPVIASQVWGLDIISVPPPSSGAVLIAALHVLQGAACDFHLKFEVAPFIRLKLQPSMSSQVCLAASTEKLRLHAWHHSDSGPLCLPPRCALQPLLESRDFAPLSKL